MGETTHTTKAKATRTTKRATKQTAKTSTGKKSLSNVGSSKKAVKDALPVKPKRYGAINEYDVLHDNVLRSLAALGRIGDLAQSKLKEFTIDMFVYGAKFYPDWTIDEKTDHGQFIKDIWETLQILGKYDWSAPSYPTLITQHAKDLHFTFTKTYRYRTFRSRSAFYNFWDAAAEVTGYHKVKEREEYITAEDISDAFKVRELITDVMSDFWECEDQGIEEERKALTEASMNGDYMNDGTKAAIRNGDRLQLKYVDFDDPLLSILGQLVAVSSEKEKDDVITKKFSIGRLEKYQNEYSNPQAIKIRYANGDGISFSLSEDKAIYLVSKK